MPLFSTGELAAMQATQNIHMQDEGIVYAYSTASADDFGNPVPTYTAGTATVCGFKPTSGEVQRTGEVGVFDAKLRLPIDTLINEHDRFLLTKRYGVAISSQLYAVFGPAERGPSGLVVNLKLVTE